MTKTYLDWLDEQITMHEREIAKLEISRAMFTEYVAEPVPAKPKPKSPVKRVSNFTYKQVAGYIKEALHKAPTFLNGVEIATAVAHAHGVELKKIQNTIYTMRIRNEVKRTEEGQYYTDEKPARAPDL